MLIAGYDSKGPHLYETSPSANYFNCKAMSIGARSQAARTYFEKKLDEFKDCTLEELINHGLVALRECLPADSELTSKNVSIAVVGKDQDLKMYDDDDVQPFLNSLDSVKGGRTEEEEEETMEVDQDQGDQPAAGQDVSWKDILQLYHWKYLSINLCIKNISNELFQGLGGTPRITNNIFQLIPVSYTHLTLPTICSV